MLKLWFDEDYSTENWSIRSHINELSALFLQLRLPSTTTRLPRKLLEFKKFKANELRTLLLFGHIIFSTTLKQVYYSHLLQLLVLMHMAESKEILPNHLSIMVQLSNSFVLDFAELYTPRHCVQVMHSVVHIPATVMDCGPLTNFTNFNFEDILG
jgi:hypothetical protein